MMARTQIREGKIVPVVITVNLIKKAIEREVAKGKTVFLVDGFPRDQENVRGTSSMLPSG